MIKYQTLEHYITPVYFNRTCLIIYFEVVDDRTRMVHIYSLSQVGKQKKKEKTLIKLVYPRCVSAVYQGPLIKGRHVLGRKKRPHCYEEKRTLSTCVSFPVLIILNVESRLVPGICKYFLIYRHAQLQETFATVTES